LKEYRVTKYNPALRDPNGAYHGDDWIMFSEIGQSFRGVILTMEEYRRVENAYITAALAFLSEGNIAALRVVGLENSRKRRLDFAEGSILPGEKLSEAFAEVLRGELWCRFQADDGFVHFGWDYYMYIGVPHRCPRAEHTASKLGLYVEEFVSPHHDDAGK